MMDMTITDATLLHELDRLASCTGRDVSDLVTEILREHLCASSTRISANLDDAPGSAAKLLADIRADFAGVGWLELDLSDRRTLP